MTNVQTKVENGKLTIEIDLTEENGPSKTGKTIVIASTKGNIEVEPGIFLGVNCYKKK